MGETGGAGDGGDQFLRDDHDGAHTAVRGGAQADLEAVRLSEAADDGEAEARGLPQVVEVDALLGLAQHPLGALAGLLAHRDAAVLDLDGDARLHVHGGQVDAGLRRRVAGGVVEELGQRVDERLDGGAGDGDLGDRVQFDPLVVDDAGHGAAQHAVEGDGPAPLAAGAGSAEDGDGVREAADEGGSVVDAQQVAEDVRPVAVPVLHRPQLGGLLVHDGLDAAGDVDEGALRGLAQVLLRDDGVHDHADDGLVLLRGVDGGEHILGELPAAQPLDGVRQQGPGQVRGLGVAPGQGGVAGGDRAPQLRQEAPSAGDLGPQRRQGEGGDRPQSPHGAPCGSGNHGHQHSGGYSDHSGGQQPHERCRGPRASTSGRRFLTDHQHPQTHRRERSYDDGR